MHRRTGLQITHHHGIPVTPPVCTLVDLAARLSRNALEAAINEADELDVVRVEDLRVSLDTLPPRPGLGILREILDRRTFTLTDSELERWFLPIARSVGLSKPETRRWVNGYKVDFYWPELGLVVETHGWRYHRTPAQQARDLRRQHAHTAAGLTPLSFTHGQVRFERGHVQETLIKVVRRLSSPCVSWQTAPRR